MTGVARGGYPGRRLGAGEARGLCSAACWDASIDQAWGLDWHCNEGIEVGWLESGSLEFATEDGAFLLRPGDLTITRPWQRHRVGSPNVSASRYHWIILDVGVRGPNGSWRWPGWVLLGRGDRDLLARSIRLNAQPVWPPHEAVAAGFCSLARAVASPRRAVIGAQVAINEVLLALCDLFQRERPPLDETFSSGERAVRLFLENLRHRVGEGWTLESMAEECHLGRTQFSRHCRQLTNRSPLDYLAQCRIARAKHLLACRADVPVTEIGFLCGFSSSQYFATKFREVTGCAPRDWRGRRT